MSGFDSVEIIDIDYNGFDSSTGKNKKERKRVSTLGMFKHTVKLEKLFIAVGILCALGQGALLPVFTIYIGNMINSFEIDFSSLIPTGPTQPDDTSPVVARRDFTPIDYNSNESHWEQIDELNFNSTIPELKQFENIDMSQMMQSFDKDSLYECIYITLILAGISFCCMFGMNSAMKITSETHVMRIRRKYMKAVISQEMGWYDSKKAGEITEHFGGDIEKIELGFGLQLGLIFISIAAFVGGWIVGFIRGWQLALIILAVMPVLILTVLILVILMHRLTSKIHGGLAKAGGVAEEVIVSMRTVTSLNCQEFSAKRYERHLADVYKIGIKRAVVLSICFGVISLLIYSVLALSFFYGSYLVRKDTMTAGEVMNVFMAVMIGSMAVGQMAPGAQTFGEARGCAYDVFDIIDRESQINPFDSKGKVVELKGDIIFDKVKFVYPTRPSVQVLKGVSFSVEPGETLAFVGPSGCGKSTSVGLLERFYDRADGNITIDGIPIEDINISCLREQIGIVGQEPVLFAMTIKENIKLGSKADVTDEQVYEACKMANIYDFIMNLKDQFDTMVGERGVQLSGGQKQRIAIARALIKNPKILILDEATSALDTESEGIVQQALENASKGRTTIVIAHRLSTVRNANQIIVIDKGLIKEQGNHNELMRKKGLYHSLVNKQMIGHGSKTHSKAKSKNEKSKSKKSKKKVVAPKPTSKKKKQASTIEDENLLPDEEDNSSQSETSSVNSSSGLSTVSPSFGVTPPPKAERMAEQKMKYGKRLFEEEDLTQHHPYPTNKRKAYYRLFKYVKPSFIYYVMNVVGSVCNGTILPIFSWVFSEIMVVLLTPNLTDQLREQNKKDANRWSFIVFMIAIAAGFVHFLQMFGAVMSAERLTKTVRAKLFRAFMRQNIAYFDDKTNSTGVLTTRLATDPLLMDTAVGLRIGTLIQAFAALTSGIIVGFTGSYVMASIILACIPFLICAQFFNIRFILRSQVGLKRAYEESTTFAVEAIESIRTVAMLGQEEYFMRRFKEELRPAHIKSVKTAFSSAVAAGLVAFIQMGMSALAMYVMSEILERGSGTMQGAMRAQMAITFGAMSITMVSVVQGQMTKSMIAIKHFFHTMDRIPLIDSESSKGSKRNIKGDVEFKDIEFIYPTRKQTTILRGFNLKIPVGTSMALVGPSGCGKSTTVGMVERFYDPKDGQVLIDGVDIKDYNIRALRSQIGLVSQEPVLFGMTIRENIKMGAIDREVTDEEIIAACKKSNAHKFIMGLPEGYNTQTGEKGAQLSGGQKQRIAIARSLIADPKILILDEATSALDTESEGIVQQALDKATEGRTTIMIAHRLSTVQKADCIAVIKKGKVVEMGTHRELIANQKSEYYRLAKKQLKKEIPVNK